MTHSGGFSLLLCSSFCGFVSFGWLWWQGKKRLGMLQQALQALQTTYATQRGTYQTLQADMAEKRQEIQNLKQELGALRKKHYTAQENIRTLHETIKDERKFVQLQQSKPAFTETAPVVVKPVPAPVPKPVPVVMKIDDTEKLQLIKKVKALEDKQAQYDDMRDLCKTLKEQLRHQQKRCDDLRKIDMISKSKKNLLEDKLARLGKDYYDAISELAALKGEVAQLPERFHHEAVSKTH